MLGDFISLKLLDLGLSWYYFKWCSWFLGLWGSPSSSNNIKCTSSKSIRYKNVDDMRLFYSMPIYKLHINVSIYLCQYLWYLLFQYSWAAGLSKTPPAPVLRTAWVWGIILENITKMNAEQATISKWTFCLDNKAVIFFEECILNLMYFCRLNCACSISSMDFLAPAKYKNKRQLLSSRYIALFDWCVVM